MGKVLELSPKHGNLIANVLARGVNAFGDELSSNEKKSTLIVADAFRSIQETTSVSFIETKEISESRYHLTDEQPFTVVVEDAERQLGAGWLIITEKEYAFLSGKSL